MSALRIADLFCGAGGTSTGAVQAARALGHAVELTAVNHWDWAVATHEANHPEARHLCASVDSLNPRHLYPDGRLDILWASPECTHHSRARGGKPMNDQSRATAWCVTAAGECPDCLMAMVIQHNTRLDHEDKAWGRWVNYDMERFRLDRSAWDDEHMRPRTGGDW